MRVYDCEDLAKFRGLSTAKCCSSCHEDDDQGYVSLPQHESDDATEMVEVCCAFHEDVPKDSSEWAALRELFP